MTAVLASPASAAPPERTVVVAGVAVGVVDAEYGRSQGGGDGHGKDEADRPDQHADDLDSDDLAGEQATDGLRTLEKNRSRGKDAPA
jgi:hypothetical protein